ncbi:unnamed protein product [Paramecium octaurelia]|uniref:Uncharacterized protein n=1 Tax=Paramecium octaurelia TaxID=43137 RepID=A0A8S1XAG2_PAROT|nr:unnamed protein product [Paramecium octaurelia]
MFQLEIDVIDQRDYSESKRLKGKLAYMPNNYEEFLDKGGYQCKMHSQRATYKHLIQDHLNQSHTLQRQFDFRLYRIMLQRSNLMRKKKMNFWK